MATAITHATCATQTRPLTTQGIGRAARPARPARPVKPLRPDWLARPARPSAGRPVGPAGPAALAGRPKSPNKSAVAPPNIFEFPRRKWASNWAREVALPPVSASIHGPDFGAQILGPKPGPQTWPLGAAFRTTPRPLSPGPERQAARPPSRPWPGRPRGLTF